MKLNRYQAWHYHRIAKIKQPFNLWIKEKPQGKMQFFGEWEDNEMLTYNITLDIVWHENFSGTLEDFMFELEINHPNKRSIVRREYDKAVSFLKDMKKIYKKHKNALTL